MAQNVINIKDFSFSYTDTNINVLKDINLSINKGEFVLVTGTSGSGKTTLAKCLNGIIPQLSEGEISGSIEINGKNTQAVPMHELSAEIGMVFQNPEDQIFSIRVEDEIAFGVECQGYKREEILKRVDYGIKKMHLEDIKKRITFSLSGGQKQKVSIASNLAMLPSVLVLDDPTTDLDPISKQEVMDILAELKKEIDTTFLIIEHDLNDLIEFIDRIIVMDQGKVVYNGNPSDILYNNYYKLLELGIRIPDHIKLGKYLFEAGYKKQNFPIKKADVLEWTQLLLSENLKLKLDDEVKKVANENIIARFKNVDFSYNKNSPVLHDIDFNIYRGEMLAIVGHNGCGKSTLMKNLIGLLKPTKGLVEINDKDTRKHKVQDLILDIGYVFQNPDSQLFCNSVQGEVEFGLKNRGFEEHTISKQVELAIDTVGLSDKRNEHPFSLSRGERQRLAVATMLVSNPKIILLDEPTTGQDEQSLKALLTLMEKLIVERSATIVMITHDMEVVAQYADRVIVIDKGKKVLEGTPTEVFSENHHKLASLKLKPPIISQISTNLFNYGFPVISNWAAFNSKFIDTKMDTTFKSS